MTALLRIFTNNPHLKELYSKHTATHQGDSGIDLFIPDKLSFYNGSLNNEIDHQIHCEMLLDGKLVSYLLLPRSSISNTGFRMSNSVGLIDAFYRGAIKARVDNLHKTNGFLEELMPDTRLFQIVAPNLVPIVIEVVNSLEDLSQSTRGQQGFGSSNLLASS